MSERGVNVLHLSTLDLECSCTTAWAETRGYQFNGSASNQECQFGFLTQFSAIHVLANFSVQRMVAVWALACGHGHPSCHGPSMTPLVSALQVLMAQMLVTAILVLYSTCAVDRDPCATWARLCNMHGFASRVHTGHCIV